MVCGCQDRGGGVPTGVAVELWASPSSSSFRALGSSSSSMVNLSSRSSTKDLKARFTAASLSLGTLCFSWGQGDRETGRQAHGWHSWTHRTLTRPLFLPYLEQRHKLLDSALSHHDRFSPTQQPKVARLRNQDFGARVPHQSVQEETPGAGKNAVHVHWVALYFLQFGVTESTDVLLRDKDRVREGCPGAASMDRGQSPWTVPVDSHLYVNG